MRKLLLLTVITNACKVMSDMDDVYDLAYLKNRKRDWSAKSSEITVDFNFCH